MAGGAAEIIGVLAGGVLAACPLITDLIAPPKDQTTRVRVLLGSNATFSANLSGNLPSVALWDEFGQSIGTTFSDGKVVPQGNHKEISVEANATVGNIAPAYISVVNGGNDAICISAISVTAPDSTKISWSADLAVQCGVSASFISNNPAGEGYSPHCIFIDGDGSNGIKHQGFGLHLSHFVSHPARNEAYAKNGGELYCKSGPRFRMYEKLRPEDPILIFDPILPPPNPDFTDSDVSTIIGVPGKLTHQDKGALRKVCHGGGRAEVPCSRCSGIPSLLSRGGPLGPACGTKIKNTRRCI